MLKNLKVKTKLLLPLSILMLIFLLLTTSLISNQYSKSLSLKELEKGVTLATHISNILHTTQKERGMTSGFITSHGEKFKNELLSQRNDTDNQVKKLKIFLTTVTNEYFHDVLNSALLDLQKLKEIRKRTDSLSIGSREILDFYSNMNDKFLNVVIEISKTSQLPKITQNIIAYSNFLYAKEHAGIERAVGTIIISQENLSGNLKVWFINLIAIQNLYIKNFLKYVSEDGKEFYQETFHAKELKNIQILREVILNRSDNKNFDIDPEYWFKNITLKIDKLNLVDDYLEEEIIFNIQSELNDTYKLSGIFAFLNVISISVFMVMVILVIRLIKNEKRLKDLTDKYIISSTTDLKGIITDVSEAFCDISQYEREELIGKPHNIIRHPDMPRDAFKDMWDTIQKGQTWQGKVKNLKKDGGYYWVYANVEPLFDKKGNIEAYAAVRLDITDSINLKEELQRSEQKDKTMLHQSKLAQMGEMISMIAHQWRQPLNAIALTTVNIKLDVEFKKFDLLSKDGVNKCYNDLSKGLDNIEGYVKSLSDTIDDFRGFYKEDKEKVEIKLSTLVEGSLEIVLSSIENQNIKLTTDFRCTQKVNTFPNEIRQVILNLIKNAEDVLLEKNIKDPYIHIRTYNDDNCSYLEISDNGGGVPQEIIENIFDPYFSTKIQKDGTGLGLYMSKTIIKDHCDGILSVYNNNDGAVFKIQLNH